MADIARIALLSRFRENDHLRLINFEAQAWEERDASRAYKRFGLTYLPEEANTVVEIVTKEAMIHIVREMQQRDVVYIDFRQYQQFYTFTLYYVV